MIRFVTVISVCAIRQNTMMVTGLPWVMKENIL